MNTSRPWRHELSCPHVIFEELDWFTGREVQAVPECFYCSAWDALQHFAWTGSINKKVRKQNILSCLDWLTRSHFRTIWTTENFARRGNGWSSWDWHWSCMFCINGEITEEKECEILQCTKLKNLKWAFLSLPVQVRCGLIKMESTKVILSSYLVRNCICCQGIISMVNVGHGLITAFVICSRHYRHHFKCQGLADLQTDLSTLTESPFQHPGIRIIIYLWFEEFSATSL